MPFPRPTRSLPALAGLVLVLALAGPALAAASSSLGSTGTAPSTPAPEGDIGPPTIVMIVADDLDAGSIGEMPNLRSLLIEQGASVTNAFLTTSLCCPSRASILRGQYVHNHGVLTNAGEQGGSPTYDRLDREEDSLPT